MSEVTYASIESLIDTKEVTGSSLAVTFRCPESGEEVSSSASLRRLDTMKSTAARSAKKNMWSSLRRSVTRAVTDALGSGAAGRIARDVANTGMRQGEKKMAFGKEEVQAGVVEAFKAVQASFQWDGANDRWIAVKKPANRFEEQLASAPVQEKYDQGILARALIELSAADGEVSEEEVSFISDFIDPSLGTIDELGKRPPLSAEELTEANEAVRPTILMLAWACAMCDEDLDDAEAARLGEIAQGMGIEGEAADGLRADAQQFLFEQALGSVYQGGSRDEEAFAAANEAAEKMGIPAEQTAKIDAAYRRAAGIV